MSDTPNTVFPNIDFRFRKGTRKGLDKSAIVNGSFNVCKDTRELFIDIENKRIQITDAVLNLSKQEILGLSSPEKKIYLSIDTFELMWYDPETYSWKIIGADNVDHADKATHDNYGNPIFHYYESKQDAKSKEDSLIQQIITTRNNLQSGIDKINTTIGDIERFDIALYNSINELPTEGAKGILYFVLENPNPTLSEGKKDDRIYAEYIWISESYINKDDKPDMIIGYYEKIGITTVDLTDYYTIQEINNILSDLRNDLEDSITELNVYDCGDEG